MRAVVVDNPPPPPTPPAAVVRAAAGTAALGAHIGGFELLKVNQTTTRVGRGGSRPLCQAIPFTALRVRIAWAHARPGQRLSLDVRAPGHATVTRTLRLASAGSGRSVQELTPGPLGLRDAAFPQGRYRFTLRVGPRRLDRTTLTLTGGVRAC